MFVQCLLLVFFQSVNKGVKRFCKKQTILFKGAHSRYVECIAAQVGCGQRSPTAPFTAQDYQEACLCSDFKSKVCMLYQDTPINGTANKLFQQAWMEPPNLKLFLLLNFASCIKLACITFNTRHHLYLYCVIFNIALGQKGTTQPLS